MNVLIDTNVALHKLLEHPAFFQPSDTIFKLAELGYLTGHISASAVTDIYYIARKTLGKAEAAEALKKLLHVFHPATVTGENIFKALELNWGDFEDSVQFVVGENLSVDYIITYNTTDFSSGIIPAITPEYFIKVITEKQ